MAIFVDASSANIKWVSNGAAAACHTGRQFAILHCSVGANLGAGDSMPAGKVRNADAMQMEASVFVEATANEFDMADQEFGIVQVTELIRYEFLYAGRLASEGSCRMNLMAGFTANPSLDVQRALGSSVDDRIFDVSMQQSEVMIYTQLVLFGLHGAKPQVVFCTVRIYFPQCFVAKTKGSFFIFFY